MSRITIEKYVAGALESRFDVPGFVLRIVAWTLPGPAIAALKHRGMDIAAMRDAQAARRPYMASLDVMELGVKKKVLLFVH